MNPASPSGRSLMPSDHSADEGVAFLDKDGTLVEDVPYNVDPQLLRFTPGALEAVSLLDSHGWPLVIVTNQSGIARGLFSADQLLRLRDALFERVWLEAGVQLAGFFYCPHGPATLAGGCSCRKPLPGLLFQAARAYAIDLSRSWMVGDILNDVQAGRAAGCRTVLLEPGGETEGVLTPERTPDHRCHGLLEAAQVIASSRRTA